MELILLSTSFLIFSSFIIFIILNYGVQHSISASYYKLKGNQKILFTLALWGFTIPIIIYANTGLLFYSGAFICFVGVSPAFKNKGMEKKVHLIGAYTGIILGFISLLIDYNEYYLVLGSIFIISNIIKRIPNYIWWIEVISFCAILLGLII